MFESPLRNVSTSGDKLQTKLGAEARDKRIDSSRLLAGSREIVIDHAGQEYRLRLTRNDKLILTK
jgi:hemin uptake protein HemP